MSISVSALARTVDSDKRKFEETPTASTAASLDGLVMYMSQEWHMEQHEALQVLRRLCGLNITTGVQAQAYIRHTPDGVYKDYVRMWDAQLRQFYNNTNWNISTAYGGDRYSA